MGGIGGTMRFDGGKVARRSADNMAATMPHRARDGTATWARAGAALYCCATHTVPGAGLARQPLVDETDRFVLVFDGRLDNWEELSRDLGERGVPLRSTGDAELTLKAFLTWGHHCAARLDGDFAFLVWDSVERTAFGARDRLGQRPFLYASSATGFHFASEMRALLLSLATEPELNLSRLAELLADHFVTLDETIWRGVRNLPPAHFLVADASGVTVRRYWSPEPATLPRLKTLDDHAAFYRDLIFDQVRRASRSDEPLAFEVSGGLDSSALFLIAAALQREGRLLAPDIAGYTLTFPEGGEAEESALAEAVARAAGRALTSVERTLWSPADIVEQGRRERDLPDQPINLLPYGLRERVRVDGQRSLVSGLGGDEWLGNAWMDRSFFVEQLASLDLAGFGQSLRAEIRDFGWRTTAFAFLRHGMVPFLPERGKQMLRNWRAGLFGKDDRSIAEFYLAEPLQQVLTELGSSRAPVKAGRGFSGRRRARLAADPFVVACWSRALQTAATQGIEMRAPYRSRAVVEWSLAIPAKFMTVGRLDRIIHRLALKDLMPRELFERAGKADFFDIFEADLVRHRAAFEQIATRRAGWFGAVGPDELSNRLAEGTLSEVRISRYDAVMALWGALSADGLPE